MAMKKYIIPFLIIMLLYITGCGLGADENDSHYANAQHENEDSEKQLNEVLRYFNEKDADSLAAMFSPEVQEKYDLRCQIEYAFAVYNGKSVNDGEFDIGGIVESTAKDGVYVEKLVDANLRNIRTDNDDIFRITIQRKVVDDKNPQAIGVERIYLRDGNSKCKAAIGKISIETSIAIIEQNRPVDPDADKTASILVRNGKTDKAHNIKESETISDIENKLQNMTLSPCSEESYEEWDYKYTLCNKKNQVKVMYIFKDGHCCIVDDKKKKQYYTVDDTDTYNELIEFAKSLVG